MELKKYKAKLHIATGPYSFVEVELEEDTVAEVCKKNDLLLKHYEKAQK